MASKRELATLKRLCAEFGAEILVAATEFTPLSRPKMLAKRWRALNTVNAGPCWFPDDAATVALIYEAPFGPETANWRGRAARLLRYSLRAGGFEHDDCAYIAMWPARLKYGLDSEARGAGDGTAPGAPRAPTARELDDVRPRIDTAIAGANCRYIMFVGSPPQQLWRPDLKLMELAGHVGIYRPAHVCMVIAHPNAILREAVDPEHWRWQIAKYGQIIDEDVGLLAIEPTCLDCRAEAVVYDPYGIGYCELHVDNRLRAAYNLAHRKTTIPPTEGLFDATQFTQTK